MTSTLGSSFVERPSPVAKLEFAQECGHLFMSQKSAACTDPSKMSGFTTSALAGSMVHSPKLIGSRI
jgi:hypothetical protein